MASMCCVNILKIVPQISNVIFNTTIVKKACRPWDILRGHAGFIITNHIFIWQKKKCSNGIKYLGKTQWEHFEIFEAGLVAI